MTTKRRPRVAITTDRSYSIEAYVRAVERAGGEAVAVLPGAEEPMEGIDALLLAGGSDIDPKLYGAETQPETDADQPERDVLELAMLGHALAADIPVLGICRGFEIFNIAHGGTLHQHIGDHTQPKGTPKSAPAHEVRVERGSRLAKLLGSERAMVNSRHHQAVDKLGRELLVSAKSADGTIEGLERTDRRFAVAVQWHPEDLIDADAAQFRLFEGLIESARVAES